MIHIDDIHKSYGELKALDGLSLHVREGEVFGLLGPNGAGKTTTVSILVGLFPPDRGSVSIGKGGASEKAGGSERGSPTDRSTRARIGLAPQALALYDDLTGEENLAFFGRLQGLTGGDLGSRVGRALDFVGLSDRGKDRAKGYSGGMRRRLNLAAALLHDPPVLLLDEPTAGVDPQSRNALFENVKALRDQGRTVVYTTHYMEEASASATGWASSTKGGCWPWARWMRLSVNMRARTAS